MTEHETLAVLALVSAGLVLLLIIGIVVLWDAYRR